MYDIETELSSKQYNSIDLMKIIMSIAVIAIHTEPLVGCENTAILSVYKVVTDLAVPFFFLSSGYLVFEKILDLPKEIQKHRIKVYIKKILQLYITWNILYLPITMYDYILNGKSIIRNLFAFVKGLVFVGCHWNSWPLWYLLSVFYSFVLIYFCMYKKNFSKKIIIIIAGIIYLIANQFTILIEQGNNINRSLQKVTMLMANIFENGRIFTGLFYIVAGLFIAYYRSDILKSIYNKIFILILFCLSLYGKIVLEGLQERMALAVLAVNFFILSICLNIPNSKCWSLCRKLSTKIFLLHMMVYSIFDIVVIKNRYAVGSVCFIVTALVTVLVSIVWNYLEIRITKKY